MTEILIDDVEGVICIIEGLINDYINMSERFRKKGQHDMMISSNGSLVAMVRLLSIITDKPSQEWFEKYGQWVHEDD